MLLGDRINGLWRGSETPPLASVASSAAGGRPAVSGRVEIPSLVQMTLAEARILLKGAGLKCKVKVDRSLAPSPGQRVNEQQPAAGTVVAAGSSVTIVVSPAIASDADSSAKSMRGVVVVIDPADQSLDENDPEVVGPGASSTTTISGEGSTGIATGVPEYEVNRQLATVLETKLSAMGMKVILTRTTDDVDLSNAERAAVANRAKAALFVRVGVQSSVNKHATGIETLSPEMNRWTKGTAAKSLRAALTVQQNAVAATGANDLGTTDSSDSVFNWCAMPGIAVQAGFLSNSVEDRLLSSAEYQDQVCEGLANGIEEYLSAGE